MKKHSLRLEQPDHLKVSTCHWPCQSHSHGDLLFLHGGGGDLSSHYENMEYMCKFFDVYAFVLPGFDGSSVLYDYTLDNLLQVIAEVVAKQEINNPVLMGHSFGAGLAVNYALRHKVKMLVLCSPLIFPMPTNLLGTGYNMWQHRRNFAHLHKVGGVKAPLKDGLGNALKHAYSSIQMHNFIRRVDLGAHLEQVQAPAVGFIGRLDTVLPPALQRQNLQRIPKVLIHEFPESGHHLMFRDDPARTKIILEFLP